MNILSLDVGTVRIGIAKAEISTKIAIPVGFIKVDNGNEWLEIKRFAKLYNTAMFVIGLPRNNEGNETAQSKYVRTFAKKLQKEVPNAKIRFQDESLTSVEAEKRLKSRKRNYDKGEIDAEAASIILQDFLDHFAETSTEKKTGKLKKSKDPMKIKKSKKIRTILLSIFIIIGICGLAAGGISVWYNNSLLPVVKNCGENRCKNIDFVVENGDTISTVAEKLKNAGLIQSSFFFKVYFKINYASETAKKGSYVFNQSLSTPEIAEKIMKGASTAEVFNFTIKPGETIMTIKKRLLDLGYDNTEIETAFNKQYDFPMLEGRPANATLEGFLFGETIEFYKGASVEKILTAFLKLTQKAIDDNNLIAAYQAEGLSLWQGIILASIVQKESYPADQPTVAQVFISRYKAGWHLGSDVTSSYAADVLDPERKTYTSNYAVIRAKECHNTRAEGGQPAGLPCGPISNPSLSALLAVAYPTDTNYMYFLTGDDGKMYYGKTESDHNRNIRNYCKKLCNAAL